MIPKILSVAFAALLIMPNVHSQALFTPNWIHSWGGTGTESGTAVATDSSGNAYVAGSTSSFGAGGQDVLLLKYDSSGNQVWAQTWGGPSNDFANGVLVDGSGNVYVVGGTQSSGAGSYDVLVLKFDASGNLVWARTWGGGSFDVGYDLSFDQGGNLVIAAESYSFGNCTVLLKMSTDGALLSASTWKGPASYDSAYSVTVDSTGNTILTGISWDYNVNPEHNTILILKYDAQGNLLWNRNWAGPGEDETNGRKTVRTDSQGNIYVVGRTCINANSCSFDALILKIDPNGNLIWSKQWGGTQNDAANALFIDSGNNLDVVGSTADSANLPTALIQQYDSDGNLLLSKQVTHGPIEPSELWSIAATPNGGFVSSGNIEDNTGASELGPWQDTGIAVTNALGSLSTPAGTVNNPTGSIGTPQGGTTSPVGVVDIGDGAQAAMIVGFGLGSSTGTISVATNLSSASFTISGPATFSGSGTSTVFNNVPVGQYTVSFGAVKGFITPAQQTEVLTSDGTLSFTGTYTPLVLQISPTILLFSYQAGKGQALPQQLVVSTNGPPVSFNATATTGSSGQWIFVISASATTPATLTISVTSGLRPGTYSGTVRVTAAGVTNSPQEISVTLAVVAGPQPVSAPPILYVNGHALSGAERENVLFIATTVIPQLLGDRDQRISVASRSTWWALKEGVLSIPNPNGFSRCTEATNSGTFKDVDLKPLETCAPNMAWQVGIAAVQVPDFSDVELLATIQSLWPSKPITDVLEEAAQFAGYGPSNGTGTAIVGSSGYLQQSWILRQPVVGVTLVEQDVTPECVSGSAAYCYGTGWLETKEFAPDKDAALKSIADLAEIFDKYSPQ